jgi:2-isopropylmalate synthase
MPREIYEITSFVRAELGKPVGVHVHNDRGLAIANSLAAVEAGADHVQCTINGVGERCGNADLIQVVGNLELGLKVRTGVDLSHLTELSSYFYELASDLNKNHYQPFTGTYAFAHKGGIHIHAVLKCPEAYEHVNPSLLGNKRIIPVSSQVGLAGIVATGKKFGFTLDKNDPQAKAVLRKIKEMEAQGYNFENAQASLFSAYARSLGVNLEFFRLLNWRATVERVNSQVTADCTVKVKINEDVDVMTAEGNGPVNAFDLALRKALETYYPELKKLKLVGYRVREINVEKGTAAAVRVFIEFEANHERFSAVGVSTNILKASEEALVEGYIYYLHKIRRNHPY